MIRVTDLKENLITDNSRLRLNGKIITCTIKPYTPIVNKRLLQGGPNFGVYGWNPTVPDYPNEDSSAVLSHAGVLFFYCVVLTSESVDKIL